MRKFYLFAVLLAAMTFGAGCGKDSDPSWEEPVIVDPLDGEKGITADFDPAFALKLREKGYIPDAEKILFEDVKDIESIDVAGEYSNPGELTSLAGIEHFKSLSILKCGYNQLTALDVTKNTALTKLYCNSNQLSSLDVSENTALTYLDCTNNPGIDGTFVVKAWFDNGQIPSNFTTGSWSGITIDYQIDYQKETDITADFDPAFALKLREKGYIPDAEKILFEDVKDIESIDVAGEHSNPGELTSLAGIGHFKSLSILKCGYNQLPALDVTQNTALTSLDCTNNQLTALDVTKNTALRYFHCYNNQLTALDVTQNTALTYLYCYNNQLTALDVTKNTALTYLHCYNNQLTALDVTQNTALRYLYCYNNQLSSLDVSKNTALTSLRCDNNPGTGGTFVVYARFDNSQIPNNFTTGSWSGITIDYQKDITADFDPAFALKLQEKGYIPDAKKILFEDVKDFDFIDVAGEYSKPGELTSLAGIEHFKSLSILACGGNRLSSLDVTQNTALTELYCDNNQLSSLDVSKNTALIHLICGPNKLSSLDVSKNTALTVLYCHYNQLTALDVTQNTALTLLVCNNNQLTTLDVTQNTALTELYCNNNPGTDGTFVVKAWFDNSQIPNNFTTAGWSGIMIDYQKVN